MAALIEIKWNPTRRELRQFGSLLLPAFLLIVAWVARRRGAELETALAIAAAGGLSAVVGLVAPRLLRPLFVGLMLLTFPIGFVVSHLVLAAVYFGVLTPIGLLLRAMGKDPLERRIDRRAESYWVEHRTGGDPARYFRQF